MKVVITILATTLFLLSDQFSDYWYSGKAEVSVYELKQARYGEVRNGNAVLIFVTEPFSKKKHVKLDYPERAGNDRTTVMKLNKTKNFLTGIYPYSVMTSAFSTVNTGKLLKATTSVQEWCGHVFIQANAKNDQDYRVKGYSYFESEGDQEEVIKDTNLEESILLHLKLNTLKEGKVKMTPSQEQSRLLHFTYKPASAQISIEEHNDHKVVTVSYHHPLELKTTIKVSNDFPYKILGWEESFVKNGLQSKTTATLKTAQQLPYWQMNTPSFEAKRKEIGLRNL